MVGPRIDGPGARPSAYRYREIARVFARHGLGFLTSALGVERYIPFHRRLFGTRSAAELYSRPERVRLALEELGPAFIKLGQILSTRVDLLPPEYIGELSRLQDSASPLPAAVVRQAVEADLGRPVDQVFASFQDEALAAASIGQVHAAVLDGAEVAVKVRRPGVVERIQEDLEILRTLASTAARRSRLLADYDIVSLVEEFAQTLRAETDYLREASSAERFRQAALGRPFVHVPRVFWQTTTARILTLERIHGVKIDDVEALDRLGIDRHLVAERDADTVLTMIFDDGFFHADPHPGNFFVGQDASIGIVDFGMVGHLDPGLQDRLAWALLAFSSSDLERQVDVLFELGIARRRVDREALRRDLQQLRARYYGRALGEIPVRQAVFDGLAIVRRHRLQLPPNVALLAKTLVMHETLVRRLDPSFDATAMISRYGRRMIVRQLSPGVLGRLMSQGAADWAQLWVDGPKQLRRVLGMLERGDLEVGMRPAGLEAAVAHLERITNRLIAGILVAAMLVAAAIVFAAIAHR
ncbi:MAG TPA: AarF/ABC1/UbiB kinase family protein [Candidatus Limnocylindrales bacterium]|nr:AarF/ABC1/UbiB kinase family protein [Candidatus Limnocylindrales bacterium]